MLSPALLSTEFAKLHRRYPASPSLSLSNTKIELLSRPYAVVTHRSFESKSRAIVVNKSNKISDLSVADVRKLFLGEKGTLPNGRRIVLLMSPAGTPERAVILRQIYRMTESEFSKYILQSAFTGRQPPPREVVSRDMKRLVTERPDVIGYLPVSQVDDAIRPVLVIQ